MSKIILCYVENIIINSYVVSKLSIGFHKTGKSSNSLVFACFPYVSMMFPFTGHWSQEGGEPNPTSGERKKREQKKNHRIKNPFVLYQKSWKFQNFLSILCETLKNDVFPWNCDFWSPHTPIFEDDLVFKLTSQIHNAFLVFILKCQVIFKNRVQGLMIIYTVRHIYCFAISGFQFLVEHIYC